MSVRVSSSPAVGEDRAQQASLLRGSLTLNEAEEAWAPKKKISEPFVPLHPGPGSQKYETMDISPVPPAMSAAPPPPPPPPPPVNLPSRPRQNSQSSQMIQVMPRVSTSVAQHPVPPSPQRSVSTDVASGDSPARSSRVSLRMSYSTATSQGPDSQELGRVAPSSAVVTAESRRIRPGSATEIEWQRIQQLRVDNWSLRSQIHEMRSTLRQIQRAKSDADDILFRRMSVQGTNLIHGLDNSLIDGHKSLKELMDDCQAARDKYGPLEDDCNHLEDRLSAQEFELDRLEEHFYNRPLEETNVLDQPLPPMDINDSQLYSSSAEGEDEEDEYHPLVSHYLSRLGDLDILRERLDDLRDDKRALEEQRETRRRMGMTLDPESQRWLDNAQATENDLRRNIRTLQKDLEMMKQDCLSKGLIDEDGEPTGFETMEQRSFNDEEEMSPLDQKSEYVKYPLLLPHPGIKPTMDIHYEPRPDEKSDPTAITNPNMKLPHLPHPLKYPNRSAMYNLLSNLEKWNSTARINEWILQRLRGSALEVNLLARIFQSISGDITDRWQIAVLRLWFRDATMRDMDGGLRVSTNSMTTQAPAISNPSRDQIKIPGGNGIAKGLPFSALVSQSAGSSIDDDEVEIVEFRPRRRQAISNQPLRM